MKKYYKEVREVKAKCWYRNSTQTCDSLKPTQSMCIDCLLQEVNNLKNKLAERNQIIQQKSNDCCNLIELRNDLQDKLRRHNMVRRSK